MKKYFYFFTLLTLNFFSCGPSTEQKNEAEKIPSEEKQFETAIQFMRAMQTDKALSILEKIAREGQQRERALCGMGGCYLMQQKPGKALASYEKALKLDPHYYDAIVGMGSCYIDLKNYDAALEYFVKARQEQPTYLDGYRGLAITYDRLNMPDSALANAKISLANDPDAKTDYDLQQIVKKYEKTNVPKQE